MGIAVIVKRGREEGSATRESRFHAGMFFSHLKDGWKALQLSGERLSVDLLGPGEGPQPYPGFRRL